MNSTRFRSETERTQAPPARGSRTPRCLRLVPLLVLALSSLLMGATPCQPVYPPMLWGAGTAAYQHEGGITNADWYKFEEVPGAIANGDRAGQAMDFYNRYASDFDLAKDLGHNAHRLSIEWSRVEPQQGVFSATEIAHYHAVIDALRSRGIEPVVTLHHFTNPLWVQNPAGGTTLGGWTEQATVDAFVGFVAHMATEFGATVDRWIIMNEPMVVVTNGYTFGAFPPAHQWDTTGTLVSRAMLIQAIARSYDAIKANDHTDADDDGVVNQAGIAHNFFHYDPLDPNSAADATAVGKWEYFYEWSFLDTLTTGNFDFNCDGDTTDVGTTPAEGFHAEWKSKLDFIGVNYYGRFVIGDLAWIPPLVPWLTGIPQPAPDPVGERSDLGWESDAAGLKTLLLTLASRYVMPMIVTENGMLTTNDVQKTKYILDNVEAVLQARDQGAIIQGYLAWALLDTFEWTSGNSPGFGLLAVDPTTKSRRVTLAAKAFEEVIQGGAVTPAIRGKYANDGFWWGTASSAYEMEGGLANADLTEWEQLGHVVNGQIQGSGSDHYNRFETDFQDLQAMGANLNKVVLEWSRIQPTPSTFDATTIAHYHAVIDSLIAKGIRPVACLNHFSLPTWVNSPINPGSDLDGWQNPAVAYAFQTFAIKMAQEFGATVDWWQTFNEPEFMALLAYAVGLFPPGVINDSGQILQSMQVIALAHSLGYTAIHANDTADADGDGAAAMVSVVSSVNEWVPRDPNNPADVAARDRWERFANWMIKDMVTNGNFDQNLDGVTDVVFPQFQNKLDYITVTNYTRYYVDGSGFPALFGGMLGDPAPGSGAEVMDNGQELYPPSLYLSVRKTWERYHLPIMVGENGVFSLDDSLRSSGLVRNVANMQRARYEGIPVLGYMYWSFIDPFQIYLGFQHGVGLNSVDFDTKVRTRTPLWTTYQQVIAANGSTYDLLATYAP